MVRKVIGLGILSAIVVGVACGGATTEDNSGGGGGDGGLSSGCPSQVPAAGGSCSTQGIECEYGSDPNLSCETLARCDTKGWTVTPPSTGGCPTPAPGPTCPASYASVQEGASCSKAMGCAYPQGTCTCEVYCGPQYPLGHMCEAGTPLTWHCDGAPQGCPDTRPRVGSTCSSENLSCTYGDCNTIGVLCQSGVWHTSHFGCPISTKHYKQGIHYLSDQEQRVVAEGALSTRLATYEYTIGDTDPRLGFIIEDQPESLAVQHGKDRVDLYGYTSMTLAAVQMQQEELRELKSEVDDLRVQVARCQGK